MGVKVSGNFGKLRDWRLRLDNADELLTATSRSMAEETLNLVKDGFRKETDPYGNKWQKKQKRDGRKVLSGKTSRLKNWTYQNVSKGGYRISPTVEYAAPHQSPKMRKGGGGLKRPRRMMVPSKSRGLPQAWKEALTDTAADTFRAFFSGGGGGGGMGFIAAKIAGIRRSLGIKMILRRAISRAAKGDSK